MAAFPRRTELGKCLILACWNADGVSGRKLELEYFLSQHGVDIRILIETFLITREDFWLANYVCNRTVRLTLGRHSHTSPPWCRPPLSARSGPDPLGGYCHPSHTGRQTGVSPCGLSFAFPPTDLSGPDRLFRRGTTDFVGRRFQRRTRVLELAALHETGKLILDYADENSCLIFGTDTPTINPYNPSTTPMSWTL